MDATVNTTYSLTFDPEEMTTFGSIWRKIARPQAGFQRPSFTSDELIMIAEIDRAIHGDEPKGPNVTSV